jgi:hypothetical protein
MESNKRNAFRGPDRDSAPTYNRAIACIRWREGVNCHEFVDSFLGRGASLLILSTALSAADTNTSQVTFTKDVAPILYKRCVQCHHPNTEARPWARSIREKVIARAMPPWNADRSSGNFKTILT